MSDRSTELLKEGVRGISDPLLDDPELSKIAIQIYRQLVADPDATMRTIAQRLNCTERTVSRNLDKLEERGWVQRTSRPTGRPKNSYLFPRLELAS